MKNNQVKVGGVDNILGTNWITKCKELLKKVGSYLCNNKFIGKQTRNHEILVQNPVGRYLGNFIF